ncbi:type IV secretion system DNA-binding domain-containing protein [Chelativorans sp. ZYF759]|uniref:type IV secretion system DNA-binding domain-containing protein n=1 Tax=Chelativorans sp. ZYF759 TaxID=2692213 RepID=UPI00145E24D8|nr:type IV secretion system DNA-binding domain-containing protein [Chelativorans sp. ZYF759]NMG40854.1 type IV secretion system DNA-binding domain-containing protein [Chelativorans sp. ZYF759]
MSPFFERHSAWPAWLGAITAAAGAIVLAALVCFELMPPVILDREGNPLPITLISFATEMVEFGRRRCGSGWVPDPACWGSAIIESISHPAAFGVLLPRLVIVVAAAIVAGWVALDRISFSTPDRDRLTHLRGRKLRHDWDGRQSLRRHLARSGRPERDSLWLVPHVQLNRASESQNILAIGTQGSGKTALLRGWLEQMIKRGDRVVIHDVKGDFLEGLPADRFILWAPHDARSAGWDIAADISDRAAALEFATLAVKGAEHDAMWADGARALWADAIMSLMADHGESWTIAQLYELLTSSPEIFRETLERSGAASAELIAFDDDGGVQRTSMSLLITLWVAALTSLKPLADAWADVPAKRRFSVRDWLDAGTKLPPVLIIQKSAEYPALSSLAGALLVERLAGTVLAPGRSLDPTRRLALVLDEFAELGRLQKLPNLLSVGREFGVVAVAAVQDLGQLVATYGETTARALEARFGIKVVLKLAAGDTAERVSKVLIGERLVEYVEERPAGAPPGWIPQIKRETHPVVPPERLDADLGVRPFRKAALIRCLVAGLGDPAMIDVPVTGWPRRRDASRRASWLGGPGGKAHAEAAAGPHPDPDRS